MKHEIILNKKIFLALMIIFSIGNLTVNSVRLEPGTVFLNSSKDSKNNRLHNQNVIFSNKKNQKNLRIKI